MADAVSLIATRSVELPPAEAAQMWQPRRPLKLVTELSFFAFMRARRLPHRRPSKRGLMLRTAKAYQRLVLQVLRDLGYDVPDKYVTRELTPLDVCSMARITRRRAFIPDPTKPPWYAIVPDHEKVHNYFGGGHPRYEAHRKAFLNYYALHGVVGDDVPLYLQLSWDLERDRAEARAAGEVDERELHFDIKRDIPLLLAGTPYEDMVLDDYRRDVPHGRFPRRVERRLVKARIEDAMWRAMVWTMFILSRRPQDMRTLKNKNIDRRSWRVKKWVQGKKGGGTVTPAVPETWAVGDRGNNVPSLRWFLTRVSPLFPGCQGPEDPVFRRITGAPWTDETVQQFIADGIQRVLGHLYPDGCPKGHGLRRAGATWRYRWGWTLDAIARLLDDTEETALGYIDEEWVISDDGPDNRRHRTKTPQVPMLRSVGRGTRNGRVHCLRPVPPTRDEARKQGRTALSPQTAGVLLPGFEPGSQA